ncbi:ATP-dependent DNA helicase [Mycena amicta]|nr:ATP-dependent DNA helicase [Mycena amicta]
MERAHAVLKDVFGFDGFKLSQEAAIQQILEGKNTAVIFPTGGGKSLVYQVPALCFDHGLTLVISPLISLMKDQVDALVQRGVAAASLDSSLSMDDASQVKRDVLSGHLKLLYVAPERLNNESFIQLMNQVDIGLLAIDEAHCISQIARFIEEHNVERVVCLTATATPPVVQDICKAFRIEKEGVFQTPVFRPNLALRVQVAETLYQKLDILVPLLKSRTGPSIVYVTLQKHTAEVAEALASRGVKDVLSYHAGLSQQDRQQIQVIHLFMPKTLENYSQEIGRAGRDGLPSTCLMFLSSFDIPVLEGFCCGDTCAKRDVEQWLQTVATKSPSSDKTLDFNLYEQSKLNVLNLLYAQLELEWGYLRAVTPFYSTAKGAKIMNDKSTDASTVRAGWRTKGEKFEVNVVDTALRMKVDRSSLARKITSWEIDGTVLFSQAALTVPVGFFSSCPSKRYALLKPIPVTAPEIKAISDKIYADMEKREADGIARLREVIRFATDDDCLPRSLSVYFGGENTVPDEGCGTCTFCLKGQGVEFMPKDVGQVDKNKLAGILRACGERDDPRLLARMAFGVTSPRLTALKCSTSHPLFGSMAESDFNALVAAFDAECAKVEYQNDPSITVTTTATKRTYSQSTGGRGRGSGGPSKRGRR